MTNMIQFWNEEGVDYMLNEGDGEVWSSWDENDNWL